MSQRFILVPFDFSEPSRAALKVASTFAAESNAALMIVHVAQSGFATEIAMQNISRDDATTGLYDALHEVKPAIADVPVSYRLLEGNPAETILHLADEEQVEMIVMGTHGRSGIKRMVLGSVAESVVRQAKCPVLTMRVGTHEKTTNSRCSAALSYRGTHLGASPCPTQQRNIAKRRKSCRSTQEQVAGRGHQLHRARLGIGLSWALALGRHQLLCGAHGAARLRLVE